MCGIVGVLGREVVDSTLVEGMRDRLVHRGPDAAGLWSSDDGRVCLGHRRLTIIDPSPEANQPFVSADGRLVIVLNGEIYNFRSLRTELEREGVVFRTRSDTEVLLEAYRAWSDDCLERLSGMFAFAIWDDARQRLFCARDRAGEKPFYYSVAGGAFVFGSELKALVSWPGFRRTLDYTSLADFLTFGFVPDPKSIWEGARKLPPGCALTVDLLADGPQVGAPVPYWDFDLEPDGSVEDWGPAIRGALEGAAKEMSVADVPVGSFLSGGVDSSSVTAALARVGEDVRAFTIGFEDEDFDERPFAREIAGLYRTPHTERVVRADDVEPVFREKVLWHYDEPFNDHSYLPTYYVCREARKSITVALTGDGGDELFGGYGKYRLLARRDSLERRLSRPVTQLVATGARSVLPDGQLSSKMRRYEQRPEELLLGTLTTVMPASTLRAVARGPLAEALETYDPVAVVDAHLRNAAPGDVGLVNAMRYLDLKLTLGAGILTKVDRASMAVSLETRAVYLNRSLLDIAARIPGARLAGGGEAKKLLRDVLRPWLPSSVLDRPKMGFAMPLARWLRGGAAGLAERIPARELLDEVVDPAYTDEVARAGSAGREERTHQQHSLLFLEHWLERWA